MDKSKLPDGILLMVFNYLEKLELLGNSTALNKNLRKLIPKSKLIERTSGIKIDMEKMSKVNFKQISIAIKLSRFVVLEYLNPAQNFDILLFILYKA